MSATDRAITLASFLKWEAPGGDVRLCNGGFIDFASERYTSLDAVFGTVADWPEFSATMDEMAEGSTLKLFPAPGATLGDWWRTDLEGGRVRFWVGEVDADLVTVSTATQQGDFLIDNVGREQGPDGSDVLALDLIARTERMFLIDEGNVCSSRFHQSVYAGELGFANCTDIQGYFAWGALDTVREETAKGGKKKKKNKNAG